MRARFAGLEIGAPPGILRRYMRYAIVSDLHANLQAFEAVLTDLSAQKADRVICLGDAIGYGPQPAEVLSLVHAHVHEMLMGNHEAAAAGLMETEGFSRGALASLASTRRKLNQAALAYIKGLPYEIESPAFRCTHADFTDPRAFGYVETAEDAARSFAACEETLLFVGHTHEPAVFVLQPDGACVQQPAADFTLEVGHRYLVNPGSVGMPRTEDPRATYCIFDTQAGRLCFHRTSYGVREFRRLVEADAQDSEQLAYVLNLLDNHALPVLHERTDFSARPQPASRPTVRRTVHVPRPQTAPAAPRTTAPRPAPPAPARRSRLPLALGLTALALTVAGGLFGLFQYTAKKKRLTTRAHDEAVAAGLNVVAASAAARDTASGVRVLLDGTRDQVPITLVSCTRGAKAYLSDAKDPITRTCLAVFNLSATNTTWQQAEWVIQPGKSGEVDLQFSGRWAPGAASYSMLYDTIEVDGRAVPGGDLETGDEARKAWGINGTSTRAALVSEPGLAHGGTACLRAGTRALATQRLTVKAGQPLKLTFWYRVPPPK